MQILSLLAISLAPILLILVYVYVRDKYEKEPIGILIKTFIAGCIITIPIYFIEVGLGNIWSRHFLYQFGAGSLASAGYSAFVVAAFTEELFKYLAFIILAWRSKNFNEKFDGIVYAVFISLGFAAVENILYVVQSGIGTGLLRAFTAVPAHALFGVTMGYYLGHARLLDYGKSKNLMLGFFVPFILHGIYDFLLMSQLSILLLLFIPFIIFMLIFGLKKMKKHSQNSVFKTNTNYVLTDIQQNEIQNTNTTDINNF